jgi:uncharacterized protein (DUF1015 family)
MAEFSPFPGLRYNSDKVSLADVLCPPYDVIKGGARDALIAKSPHNIVRVELAAPYGTDASPDEYAACAALLKQWQDEQVLVADDPAFYLYEQEFAVPNSQNRATRRGILGALRLEEFGEGVQPHEHTLSGPKADRLNLLRVTRTNTSPIFGLYTDSDGWIDGLLENVAQTVPTGEATDADGVAHRLWKITDDETVNAIVASLEGESILIADGHHRYETALNFRNECRAQAEKEGKAWTGDEDENFVLMMCVSTTDTGLIVLPTHRVVQASAEKIQSLPSAVAEHFEASEQPSLQALQTALDAGSPGEPGRFGMIAGGKYFLLQLKPGGAHATAMDASKSEAYRNLDVSILHELILQRLLGIGPAELAAGGHVAYTIDPAEAQNKTQSGGAAFLMRATPVEQVQQVANAGDKMPQKSTYFFPKLVTGLVLRPVH